MAHYYKDRSVAEQRSIDEAWALLMGDDFKELRLTICQDTEELQRFRQLLVNCVMATDLLDKDLKTLRNTRWQKAFDASAHDGSREAVNRKATVVIEQ